MKTILLIILIFKICISPHAYQESLLADQKKIDFGNYTVITGSCDKGSAIEIFDGGKSIYNSCGGDGMYIDIDTMDINKDKIPDFVFVYAFEDGSTLGMLVSTREKKRYKNLNLCDDLFNKFDCSTEPYKPDDNRLKDFIIADIDKDGNKDIITIAIKNIDGSVTSTDCSITILHHQLQDLLKRR